MKKGYGTKFALGLISVGVLAYFGLQAANYFNDPLTTTLAYYSTVKRGLELSGYVVRNEAVLPNQDDGLLRLQRSEGERVGTGGVIARIYADENALAQQEQVDTLKDRMEQLQFAQEAVFGSEVSLKLDGQIMQSLLSLRSCLTADRLDEMDEYASSLRSLVLKRDYTYSGTDAGTDSEALSEQIEELKNQINALETQAGSSTQWITAPSPGLYSAVVDGYETVLTPETLKQLTPSSLASIQPDSSVISNVGRLIFGDDWYYVATLQASDSTALKRNRSLSLQFAKNVNRELPVSLIHVSAPENGRVVAVFQGKNYLPDITLLRQQSAEVIWQTLNGIRVPKESLRVEERTVTDENGIKTTKQETGVYCVVGLEARFKPVNVLYNGDGFVLVKPTADASEVKTLRLNDEVIVTAYQLFDGKVIGKISD